LAGSENFATYIKVLPSGTDSVRVDWMLKTGTESSNGGMINFAYDINVFELQKGGTTASISPTGTTNITDCLVGVPASIPIPAAQANMEKTPGMVLVNMQFATIMSPVQFSSDTAIESLTLKLKPGYTQSTIPTNAIRIATPNESSFAGTAVAAISNPNETGSYYVGLVGTGTEDTALAATVRVEAGAGITFVRTLAQISISGNSTATVPTAAASPSTVNLTATASYDSGSPENVTSNATWSIVEGTVTGVSVANGIVTITKDAAAGEINIKASYRNKDAAHKITISKTAPVATTIAIYTDSAYTTEAGTSKNISIPTSGSTSETYYARVYDQYGAVMPETPSWSTTALPVDVTQSNGSITIASTAAAGSFNITATSISAPSLSAALTINVTSKLSHTVSDFGETAKSVTYGNPIIGQTVSCSTGTPTYTSSDDTIVAVNPASGALTVKKAGGPVTIAATVPETSSYSEVTKTYTVTVSKRELTITGLSAVDRVYDGTTTVALTGGILSNKVGSDDVSVAIPVSGVVADANVGNNKVVTVTMLVLAGAAASNYTLAPLPVITVNIIEVNPGVNRISPSVATFDKMAGAANHKDISVTLFPADASLLQIKNGNTNLREGIDYTISGNVYTIKIDYLFALSNGRQSLVFDMDTGTDPTLSITITETSTPEWKNPFYDVNVGDWFYADVKFVAMNGLFYGTSETTFSPNTAMTRGMVVTVLGRLTGIDPAEYDQASFDDVDQNQYYAPYVRWASENGIVNGIGDDKYNPDGNISRQDLATILYRYALVMDKNLPTTIEEISFNDAQDISEYAVDAVNAMQRAGIINGKPGNIFDPLGNATRAEVAAMIHRFALAL